MAIFSLVSWWYSTGWLILIRKCGSRLASVLAFFSIPQLLGSLFAPFRQISAGRVQGSLSVQLQAFGDRLFSRIIGAVVRLILIVVGTIFLIVSSLFYLLLILAWPFAPIAPLAGFVLMSMGVVL